MNNGNSNVVIKFFCIVFFVLIGIVALRAGFIAIFQNVNGNNLIEFSEGRGINKEILPAERGTIYDRFGQKVAQNLDTYNISIVLTNKYAMPGEVVSMEDIDAGAEKLGPVIGMPVEDLKALLYEQKEAGADQTELGSYGRGLSQTKMEEIEALGLTGIEKTKVQSRQYPQGVFASHTIGYATYDPETKQVIGRMGIELQFDKLLAGKSGRYEYQENAHGQKISSAPEIRVEPENGDDIYLTLDLAIQNFVEENIKKVQAEHNPEWIQVMVVDPKTGKILAMSSTPSFDPNVRDIQSYVNPLNESAVEVGSVMKPLTYAAAIDAKEGYNGQEIVPWTGSIEVDGFTINDWNRYGWSNMPYDDGVCQSSNTAIASVVVNKMKPETYLKYLNAFGFGKETGIKKTLGAEASGTILFGTEAERITTGFGQGTTATAMQMMQAYTAIANKGNMMELQLIDKIVDSNTGDLIYQATPNVAGNPISSETADYVLDLMKQTINRTDCSSGGMYAMDDFTLAGKTGTAEVPDQENGGYYHIGDTGYNYSFVGIAPADDPQYLLYATVARPQTNPTTAIRDLVKPITENSVKYLMSKNSSTGVSINTGSGYLTAIDSFPSFMNQVVADVKPIIEGQKINAVIIGNGDTIIRQSQEPYTAYYSNERVFLLTNGSGWKMPNMSGWSRVDVERFANITGIKVNIEGSGYVNNQSISEGSDFAAGDELSVTLAP